MTSWDDRPEVQKLLCKNCAQLATQRLSFQRKRRFLKTENKSIYICNKDPCLSAIQEGYEREGYILKMKIEIRRRPEGGMPIQSRK